MDDKTRKRSLFASILDGSFYAIALGFGQNFFSAFAVFLRASAFEIGLLGAVPQAVGSISQLLSDRLLRLFSSRKRLIVFWASLEGLAYIPIALVYFFGDFRIWVLALFLCAYWVFSQLPAPAWSSWMGDLVLENDRGRYFGRRNRIVGVLSFVSLLAAGAILQHYSSSETYIGFLLIFAFAFLGRCLSIVFLLRQYEPPYVPAPRHLPLRTFLRTARASNTGKLILYLGAMNLAVQFASPFFTAYMLYSLGFSYWLLTIVTGTSLIVKYLLMPLWGRAIDRYGSRRVLALTSFFVPFVPLVWLLSHDLSWLIAFQVFSGFVWAGYELASLSFLFDVTSSAQRPTYVAYNNVFSGIAMLLGGLLGALVASSNTVFWSPYLFVFLCSGLLRLIVVSFFLPLLKEVRPVEHISYKDLLFDMTAITPTMGIVSTAVVLTQRTVVGTAAPVVSAVREGVESVADITFKTTRGVVRSTRKAVEQTSSAVVDAIEDTEDLVSETGGMLRAAATRTRRAIPRPFTTKRSRRTVRRRNARRRPPAPRPKKIARRRSSK